VRAVKPLDDEMLEDAARHPLVVTVEDGIRVGGAGSAIADRLDTLAVAAGLAGPPVVQLGTPDAYIPQAKPEVILAGLGLDAQGIAESVRTALGQHVSAG